MPKADHIKRKEDARIWYEKNRERIKAKNSSPEAKARLKENRLRWRAENRDRDLELKQKYRASKAIKDGREYLSLEQRRIRREQRRIESILYKRGRLVRAFKRADNYSGMGKAAWYYQNRTKRNPRAMLDMRYRVHVRKALRGMNISLFDRYMGYSSRDLRDHIRRSMPPGMSWDDVLSPRVHIDHIIPRSAFIYESEEDPAFKACWSLENMQPLWDHENRAKGNKL